MRPAIEKLREKFDEKYPLAHAAPFLDVEGRELVMNAQEEVGLEKPLHLVVVRNDQLVLTRPADEFVRSVEFAPADGRVVRMVRPVPDIAEVVMDPLQHFGRPVVRGVPTETIAEQVRAGDRIETLADLYELPVAQVEAAIRYELKRAEEAAGTAA
jgi:uncharacterized protein (DUF433 family)